MLRGLRTLALRIRQHNENAMAIAEFLERHLAVKAVFYPGLKSHPQHDLAVRQMSGFGGMLSFEVKGGYEAADRFLSRVATSLTRGESGGVGVVAGGSSGFEFPALHDPRGSCANWNCALDYCGFPSDWKVRTI